MKTSFLSLAFLLLLSPAALLADEGWISMFDGESFKGWKLNENKDTWSIDKEKKAMVCFGPRSHAFYVGQDKPFVNFEFEAEVMTTPGSNAGIYFHTRYQDQGWPKYGYESQVNNTHKDPKKTGGLYAVSDVFEAPAKDNKWWKHSIKVEGKRVTVKIDGKTVVDYTEPKDKKPFSKQFTRMLDKGTFALQGHDPKSKVYFRNLRVKRLP